MLRADHHAARRRAERATGLRVLAVAVTHVDRRAEPTYGVADEAGLTLVGFIAFLDPPKESAARRMRRWPTTASR